MWQRYKLRTSTAIGILMAVALLYLIVLGVAVLVQLLGALLSLVVFCWLRRRC